MAGSQSSPPQYPSRWSVTAAWLANGAASPQAATTATRTATSRQQKLRRACIGRDVRDACDVYAITVIPLTSHWNDNCDERNSGRWWGQPFPALIRRTGPGSRFRPAGGRAGLAFLTGPSVLLTR